MQSQEVPTVGDVRGDGESKGGGPRDRGTGCYLHVKSKTVLPSRRFAGRRTKHLKMLQLWIPLEF